MQTFVPHTAIAKCLDYRRLGKQRVECKQILAAMNTTTGWSNHRAALLYKDPEYYSQFGWTEEPALEYHWPV